MTTAQIIIALCALAAIGVAAFIAHARTVLDENLAQKAMEEELVRRNAEAPTREYPRE